jgi:hypothetical protein
MSKQGLTLGMLYYIHLLHKIISGPYTYAMDDGSRLRGAA